MKIWGFPGFLIILICLLSVTTAAYPIADWAYRESYSPVDLIGTGNESIGYRIVAPITSPPEMVILPAGNITRWNANMGKSGIFTLEYLHSPVITREDEYFQIHERDVSFIGQPFDENNLYYDGSVYSCWGTAGETGIRYDCARYIAGDFFKLSCVFNTLEDALRNNQKLREIINTLEKTRA